MGLAFQMYTMDSQNRFNRLPAPAPTGGDPWFVAISPFLQKEAGNASDLSDVYRCQVYASLRSDLQGSTAWDQQSGEGKYYDPKLGQLRGFRHGKGGNFLFVDGHVSFLTLSTIEDVLK